MTHSNTGDGAGGVAFFPPPLGDGSDSDNYTTPFSPVIDPSHLTEWTEGSGIDPAIARVNLESISGESVFSLLYPDISHTNSGRPTAEYQRRYAKFEGSRGWWCSTLDPETWEERDWGCWKPDRAVYTDTARNRPIKYHHPSGSNTFPFFLKLPGAIGRRISDRYGIGGEDWPELVANSPILDITEGAKKTAALLSCGFLAVGVSGVWNGCPKDGTGRHKLHPDLSRVLQPGMAVRLWFDEDEKRSTRQSVDRAIAVFAGLLKRETGVDPLICRWKPELGKGIDDVLVGHDGPETVEAIASKATPLSRWKAGQYKEMRSAPSVSVSQRYLDITPPPDANLIAYLSPKGTGKTEAFCRQTRREMMSGERRVLLITHRIQLGTQTADRIGIPMISEGEVPDMAFGCGVCFDSLCRPEFDPANWEGAIVILDEINQSLDHLLNSRTEVENRRAKILERFAEIVRAAILGGGRVLCADADLRESSLDVLRAIWPREAPCREFIAENVWKFDGQEWDVIAYGGKTPGRIVRQMERAIEAGERVFVCCSSQRPKAKWGTINLEKRLGERFPELRILRIDSSTVADPEHPAWGSTAKLDEVLPEFDLVITSPTVETGVSVTTDHFDAVYGIFQGVQPPDGTRQHLGRVRSAIPRHIWLAPMGLERRGNGADNIPSLIGGEKRKSKGVDKALLSAGLSVSGDDEIEAGGHWLKCWATHAAIINSERPRYRETVLEDLEAEGHRLHEEGDWLSPEAVADIDGSEDDVKASQKAIATTSHENWCKAVSEATPVEDERWGEFARCPTKTADEQLAFQRGAIERKYGRVPVSPELVDRDAGGFYRKAKLHYLWGTGREFLAERDKAKAEAYRSANDGLMFLPDRNRQTWGNKIAVLDFLRIGEILEAPEMSNEHPLAIAFHEQIQRYGAEIALAMGASLAGKTPMESLQKLARLLGLKFALLRCERREGGKRQRIYSAPAPDFARDGKGRPIVEDGRVFPLTDGREEIFEAWRREDLERRAKRMEAERERMEAIAQATPAPAAEPAPEPTPEPEADPDTEAVVGAYKAQSKGVIAAIFSRMGDSFYSVLGRVPFDVSEWAWVALSELEAIAQATPTPEPEPEPEPDPEPDPARTQAIFDELILAARTRNKDRAIGQFRRFSEDITGEFWAACLRVEEFSRSLYGWLEGAMFA